MNYLIVLFIWKYVMEKIVITYAWAIWCWKSPITNFISTKLWLPTFNTDSIRSEVCEDFLKYDEKEAQKRIRERYTSIIKEWKSFILDASVDRKRQTLKEVLKENGYKCFIISIDLDKETLFDFYKVKSYTESIKMIDKVYEDHQKFLMEFSDDVNLHINIKNYKERLDIVYKAVKKRIKEMEEL